MNKLIVKAVAGILVGTSLLAGCGQPVYHTTPVYTQQPGYYNTYSRRRTIYRQPAVVHVYHSSPVVIHHYNTRPRTLFRRRY